MYTLKLNNSTYNVFTRIGTYGNGRKAIQLVDSIDGSPVATATVNLPTTEMEITEGAIKNYGENEGVLDFMIQNKLVSKPKRWVKSGYIDVPIVDILI